MINIDRWLIESIVFGRTKLYKKYLELYIFSSLKVIASLIF